MDATHCLRRVAEKYKGHKKEFWLAFVDLEKAFGSLFFD